MTKEVILKVENVSKQYRLGLIGTGTLSHDLNRWWAKIRGKQDPYLLLGDLNERDKKSKSKYVWALRNINFEVRRGEVLGIIGKNGAGKSTLLKILSKVTSPTEGVIKSNGRIASLLEVGTGFHPEMTGRENVFLNGAILGMTKLEIQKKLDQIIDFSGCERFIDTPVKRYSSGMKVRLAFSVAAHLEPDILVVDEVLAVGDIDFQKKAIGKMQDISNTDGRTVLFVSHDMAAISNLCTRCLLLNNGELHSQGNVNEILSNYINGETITSRGFEMKIKKDNDNTLSLTTYNDEKFDIYEGRFFLKMIDYNGIEIMLHEEKMKNHDTVEKSRELDISSLNNGVYSLQAKVWATSNDGRKVSISTPFYPVRISTRKGFHKRVFAGKILPK